MEEDINLNKAAPAPARVLPAVAQSTPRPPPPPSSSSSNPPKDEPPAAEPPVLAGGGRRQRFSVELRAGETTIVSWKKLLKESSQGGGSPSHPRGAEADLGAAVGPSGSVKPAENDLNEELPSNRFSAVIEKIERLYMGKQSSDEEELNDVPDDDQYDTEDSFIDDAELDEYFQVDKLATKHNGYFVNKGKLEQIEPSSSPNVAPRKRRRKETTKSHPENDLGHAPGEQLNVADMRVKAASRNAQFVGKKLSGKDQALHGAHYYEESKLVKSKANAHTGTYEKKSADFSLNENPTYAKVSNKDVASLPLEPKDFDKHKAGSAHPRDIAYKSRTSESYDYTYPVSRDKSASSQLDFQSKKLLNSENVDVPTKIRRKEKYRAGEFADTSTSGSIYPMQAAQSMLTGVREGASIRPKGTTLERAIRDLEKIVAEFRPPSLGLDVQEVDPACQVKRRLPQEVKQKLAKVARLSASQGKISEDELIDRLMGILGHLVQRKTLKRNMKEMVELGLSAKQQKADRFQQIKGEINEMIRSRISYIKSKAAEQPDGSAENFQEVANNDERRALKGKYSMDSTLEDKICDLYDLYVEGMDEDKGPQSRKLYVELAELWPHGYMDNVGIKDAIYRSKERRRALYRRHKVRDAERIKRKRLASANKVEDSNQSAQVRAIQERPVIDYSGQVIVSPDKLITNQPLASTGKVVDPSPLLTEPGQYQGSKNIDKVKGGNTITTPDEGNKNVIDVKRKMKRKSESDLGEIQVHPAKIPSQHTMERQKSHKHTDETNASSEPKTSLQVSGPPSSDKPI